MIHNEQGGTIVKHITEVSTQTLAIVVLLFQGCQPFMHNTSEKKIIREAMIALHTKPCIDFRWFGANHWHLS